MAEAEIRVLGQTMRLQCDAAEARRISELAAGLEARLSSLAGREPDPVRRLILVALGLMDDVQASGEALVRAREDNASLADRLLDLSASKKT